jgi:hypothetical protein
MREKYLNYKLFPEKVPGYFFYDEVFLKNLTLNKVQNFKHSTTFEVA